MFNFIKKYISFVVVIKSDKESVSTIKHMFQDEVIDSISHCPSNTSIVVYASGGKRPLYLHYNDLSVYLG